MFKSYSIENVQNFQWLPRKNLADLLNGGGAAGYFEKLLYQFLEPTLFLFTFKWNHYEVAFSCIKTRTKTRTNSKFAVKLAERSNGSFLLSTWWSTFLEHLYSLIRDNGMHKLNRSCKHMKKVRSCQASISINSGAKLTKALFFPASIVKLINLLSYWK